MMSSGRNESFSLIQSSFRSVLGNVLDIWGLQVTSLRLIVWHYDFAGWRMKEAHFFDMYIRVVNRRNDETI